MPVTSPVTAQEPAERVTPPARQAPPLPPPRDSEAPRLDSRRLFERLGGLAGVETVIDLWLVRVTADPRIQERFFNVDRESLRRALVEHACAAAGGPCRRDADELRRAVAGLELVDAELDAAAEDLAGALHELGLNEREHRELLAAFRRARPLLLAPPHLLRPLTRERLATVTMFANFLPPGDKEARARVLMQRAVIAGARGQRTYAEQLFTRAEMLIGSERLMSAAEVFRLGAPPRVLEAPVAAVAPAAAFADTAVTSRRGRASLSGVLSLDGMRFEGAGVVMLIPDRGAHASPPPVRRVIEQRDGAFAPHLLAVPVGSTVAFPNFDRTFHNVFSLSKTQPFDLGMYGRGAQREIVFDTPGVVRVGCSMHPEESAYIVVVDAPYHVVVGDGGAFTFAGVKPGAYTVRAWTDRSGEPTESRLQIEVGDNQRDLDLAGGRPLPSTDKFGVAAQDAVMTSRR